MIVHIDIDAFFASVEQVLEPRLAGRPVVVGGLADERSVVASASYEARALGVKTAMPIAQAARLCPQAVFLKGRFEHYRDFSERVMAILRDYSPAVEEASLDEAYLDATGCGRLFGPPLEMADCITRRVRAETGLTVSVGIGENRLVAKVATAFAKPNGIVEIRAGYEAAFLAPLPLRALPGIGHRTAERLAEYNLRTLRDLRRIPEEVLAATFGVHGRALYRHCRGQDDSPIAGRQRPKSISRATTFEQDTMDRAHIEAMLYYLTERATRDLRRHRLLARCVTAKLRYADFQTITKARTLDEPTDHDAVLYGKAVSLWRRLYTRRVRVRLIGVCLSSLVPAEARQMDLFNEPLHRHRERLYRGIDRVRDRFGFSALTVGRSINLLPALDRVPEGFRLRTSCLTR